MHVYTFLVTDERYCLSTTWVTSSFSVRKSLWLIGGEDVSLSPSTGFIKGQLRFGHHRGEFNQLNPKCLDKDVKHFDQGFVEDFLVLNTDFQFMFLMVKWVVFIASYKQIMSENIMLALL